MRRKDVAYFFDLKSVNWSVWQQVELEKPAGLEFALPANGLNIKKASLTDSRTLLRAVGAALTVARADR